MNQAGVRSEKYHIGRTPPSAPTRVINSDRAVTWDRFTWVAIAIIGIGALVRLYAITVFVWDQDELYTRIEARDLFHTTVQPGIDARPLYYLLQHPLLSLLPQTRVAMRLLPLLFGLAGLWVTWLAGRRHLGRVAALVAVFLASVSSWHVEASTEARYYSLLYLCAALLLLWLPDALESDRFSLYWRSLVALILGTLTHPTFLFPVAGYVLGISLVMPNGKFRLRWPSRNAWRFLWGPYLVFLAVFLAFLKASNRQGAIRNSVGRGIAATLRLIPAMVEWITPAVFGAALIGSLCLLASRHPRCRQLGAMAIVSVAVAFAGFFATSFWTDVYATYATALLPVVFLAAASLTQFSVKGAGGLRHEWTLFAVTAALFGFAIAPSVISSLSDGNRFDYRPAYRQIEQEAPTVPVVTWPGILADEYAPRSLKRLPLKPEGSYLDSALSRHGELWVVSSVKRAGIVLDDTGEVDKWLAEHCHRRGVFERPRFDYRIYRVELHLCHRAADSDAER